MTFSVIWIGDDEVKKIGELLSRDTSAVGLSDSEVLKGRGRVMHSISEIDIGRKKIALDPQRDAYFFKVLNVAKEDQGFKYLLWLADKFVELTLEGVDSVVIHGSSRLDNDELLEVKAAIKDAFLVFGRWGDGVSGDDAFGIVEPKFKSR